MTKTTIRYMSALLPLACALFGVSSVASAPAASAYVPTDYSITDPSYPLTPNDLFPCAEEDGSIPDGEIACYWDVDAHGSGGHSFVVMRASDGGVFFAYDNSAQIHVGTDDHATDVTGCVLVVEEESVSADC